MKREYQKWFSPALGREMELLVFGHAGNPALVFPTSCGRFFEFEDRGMVAAVAEKIEHGHLQLFCVDSVDSESWYNRAVAPRWRIARHLQYEQYLLQEVVPFIQQGNGTPNLAAVGCSFGGYHAVNLALRHPDLVTAFLSMGGAFDPSATTGVSRPRVAIREAFWCCRGSYRSSRRPNSAPLSWRIASICCASPNTD